MPATFDLPMEQLKTYQGRNPRPTDFDAFWDAGLAELKATDPALELIPARFTVPFADCYHMYFTGTGGARVHAKLIHPKGGGPVHPAVLRFHPYAESSGDWTGLLAYAARGFTIAALDTRGQGGRSEDSGKIVGNTLRGHMVRGLDDKPENMFLRNVFLDTARLAQLVMDMDEVDASRVGATGMSQGGALTLACAALEPRVSLVAPIAPFMCDYQRVWEMDLAVDGYAELQEYFRRFDPLHEREEEVFSRLGYVDVQHLTPRIKGTVMHCIGMMDTICPPSTQFAAYNKITSEKSMLVYPDFAHEMPPGLSDRIYNFLGRLMD